MPSCTQTITEKPPCLTVGCNRFIQNSWSGDLHTHTWPLHESWANEDSSEKITVKSLTVSWSSPWSTCVSWLCWLVGEVACVSLLYLCTQVFQGIFWLMTHSIACPVTDQKLRFEVPSPLISEGFWGILLMAQDDQNGLLRSPWLCSWIGWWHSSQWTVEWTDSWIFVADLHQPLPDQQFSPSENLWVPKNPVTEACWFTLWCIISQYIAHSNH